MDCHPSTDGNSFPISATGERGFVRLSKALLGCYASKIGGASCISSLGRKNIDSVLWNFQWHKFCGATLCIGSRFKDTDNGFHDAPPILDA
jgi:hypothetical protein